MGSAPGTPQLIPPANNLKAPSRDRVGAFLFFFLLSLPTDDQKHLASAGPIQDHANPSTGSPMLMPRPDSKSVDLRQSNGTPHCKYWYQYIYESRTLLFLLVHAPIAPSPPRTHQQQKALNHKAVSTRRRIFSVAPSPDVIESNRGEAS
jgi:hypothetical protein